MRRTPDLALLASALLTKPMARQYAHELMRATRMPGGTVHPMLSHLVKEGWLITAMEEGVDDRPPLRYWSVTERGRRELARAIAAMQT